METVKANIPGLDREIEFDAPKGRRCWECKHGRTEGIFNDGERYRNLWLEHKAVCVVTHPMVLMRHDNSCGLFEPFPPPIDHAAIERARVKAIRRKYERLRLPRIRFAAKSNRFSRKPTKRKRSG